MSKFNKPRVSAGTGAILTPNTVPDTLTHQGGQGFTRDPKSELFLLAVSNMVGEDTFYEKGKVRDSRYETLCRHVAVADRDWYLNFVRWLRQVANMRSAALVASAVGVKAALHAGLHGGNRELVRAGLSRADEPGEFLAFWTARYGRKIPSPVKRGLSDAVRDLYDEYSLLKYDTGTHAWRFADVLGIIHAEPKDSAQAALFKVAMARRFGREVEGEVSADLVPMLMANQMVRRQFETEPIIALQFIRQAGMTWEDVLSLAGPRLDKKAMWEALIPTMGFMAQLRNLRNFDQAGVSDEVAGQVMARFQDAEQVARSRQLPLRFLSAYRNAPSLRWAYPLETAIQYSLSNIPVLPGRTLILVDTSSSMRERLSARSELMRWDAAVTFGLAMAQRCSEAKVVSFSTRTTVFALRAGESLLSAIARWKNEGHFHGGGTDTIDALAQYGGEGWDRVVILTDEQANASGSFGLSYWTRSKALTVDEALSPKIPLYTWNLAGYQAGHTPSAPNRYTFGGLNDAAFSLIPLLERKEGVWPWEVQSAP